MTNDNQPFVTFAIDAYGNRVRIGLTYAETLEFEQLDAAEPLDHQGNPLPWDAQNESVRQSEDRWFELYRKHEAARFQLIEATKPQPTRSRSLSSRD